MGGLKRVGCHGNLKCLGCDEALKGLGSEGELMGVGCDAREEMKMIGMGVKAASHYLGKYRRIHRFLKVGCSSDLCCLCRLAQ